MIRVSDIFTTLRNFCCLYHLSCSNRYLLPRGHCKAAVPYKIRCLSYKGCLYILCICHILQQPHCCSSFFLANRCKPRRLLTIRLFMNKRYSTRFQISNGFKKGAAALIDGSFTSATAPEYSSAIYINVTDHFTYFITQLLLNRFVADCYYRSIVIAAQLLLPFNCYHLAA